MREIWYNKYRPNRFEEVIGQEMAKTILSNAVKNKNYKNAYLLSGSRGVGKTTLARIFANSINEINIGEGLNLERSIDIVEMDAASNTSVDDIRALIESANTPPITSPYKIFIVDEVHMLSKSAMNALLKVLEEPPVYLIFLLATTNPEKIIQTVLSRLIKITLNDFSILELSEHLSKIAKLESMVIDNNSIELIAKKANGGCRDSINLLQTIHSYDLASYDLESVARIIGYVPETIMVGLTEALTTSDNINILSYITKIEDLQISASDLINQIMEYLLNGYFNGNITKEQTTLIEVIGDISSKRLPISNITTLVSLILYHYRLSSNILYTQNPLEAQKKNNLEILKDFEIKKEDDPKITEISSVKINSDITTDQTTNLSEKTETQVLKIDTTKDQNFTQDDNEILSLLYNIIKTSVDRIDCPFVLKNNYNSIIVKYEDNIVYLNTSKPIVNKMMVEQGVSQYIGMRLINEFQKDILIQIDGHKPAVITNTNTLSKDSENNKNSFTPSNFYKVYNLRKEGIPHTVEIVTQPIPKPSKSDRVNMVEKTTIQIKSIEDIFEF